MLIDAGELVDLLRVNLGAHVRAKMEDAVTLQLEAGGEVLIIEGESAGAEAVNRVVLGARTDVADAKRKAANLRQRVRRAERALAPWKDKVAQHRAAARAAEQALADAAVEMGSLKEAAASPQYFGPLRRLVIDEMYNGSGYCIRRPWEHGMSLCGRTEVVSGDEAEGGLPVLCGKCGRLQEAVECAQRLMLPRMA